MSQDIINAWVEKAKAADDSAPADSSVRVIKNAKAQSKGSIIMELAEKLRPWLSKMLEGSRDKDGMLLQPAHIRGISLDVAQRIVNEHENKQAGE